MQKDDSHASGSVAASSGIGLSMGAAFGSVIGAVFGDWGVGLIIGAMAGIVLGPGVAMAIRGRHGESEKDGRTHS